MPQSAPYDDIADWYETEFLGTQRAFAKDREFADSIGIDQALVELLGTGEGLCLEVGCGTGVYAQRVGALGRAAIGVDISAGMLRHASDRLPVAQADGRHLPFSSQSIAAVVAVMIHTDIADYASVVNEIDRVLAPDGLFVHIGVHPCFCGDFADRSNSPSVVIRPGYLDAGWTVGLNPTSGETGHDGQVRKKVGAAHNPLGALVNTFVDAGFAIERFAEGGGPTPITLSIRMRKPGSPNARPKLQLIAPTHTHVTWLAVDSTSRLGNYESHDLRNAEDS